MLGRRRLGAPINAAVDTFDEVRCIVFACDRDTRTTLESNTLQRALRRNVDAVPLGRLKMRECNEDAR